MVGHHSTLIVPRKVICKSTDIVELKLGHSQWLCMAMVFISIILDLETGGRRPITLEQTVSVTSVLPQFTFPRLSLGAYSSTRLKGDEQLLI